MVGKAQVWLGFKVLWKDNSHAIVGLTTVDMLGQYSLLLGCLAIYSDVMPFTMISHLLSFAILACHSEVGLYLSFVPL